LAAVSSSKGAEAAAAAAAAAMITKFSLEDNNNQNPPFAMCVVVSDHKFLSFLPFYGSAFSSAHYRDNDTTCSLGMELESNKIKKNKGDKQMRVE
jgi:hypothetical protein